MSKCVVILQNKQKAYDLIKKLLDASAPVLKKDLIEPRNKKNSEEQEPEKKDEDLQLIKPISFESVELLNPKLAKQKRQKLLSRWLMPFGFITGLAFSKMTELQTFSEFGFPSQLETILGGLLGMSAGWIGSFFSSGSPNRDIDDDLRILQKKSEEGFWLLIIETPIETDLPWQTIQTIETNDIIKLNDY